MSGPAVFSGSADADVDDPPVSTDTAVTVGPAKLYTSFGGFTVRSTNGNAPLPKKSSEKLVPHPAGDGPQLCGGGVVVVGAGTLAASSLNSSAHAGARSRRP